MSNPLEESLFKVACNSLEHINGQVDANLEKLVGLNDQSSSIISNCSRLDLPIPKPDIGFIFE